MAVGLFQGSFTETVPVTVISQRAGLVMNPDAKVKMRGVQVGKVASIESLPNGQAAIHLAMDPSQMHFIPSNVLVDIASSTVFGAKSIQLVEPAQPSAQRLRAGQTLQGQHVMVEINTVFQELVSVLSHRPAETQRVPGCACPSVQWARPTAGPVAQRPGFVPRPAGAEPSRVPP